MSVLDKNLKLPVSVMDLLDLCGFMVCENLVGEAFDAYREVSTMDGAITNIHIRHPAARGGFKCTIHGPYGRRSTRNFPEAEFFRMMEWLESEVQMKIMV